MYESNVHLKSYYALTVIIVMVPIFPISDCSLILSSHAFYRFFCLYKCAKTTDVEVTTNMHFYWVFNSCLYHWFAIVRSGLSNR